MEIIISAPFQFIILLAGLAVFGWLAYCRFEKAICLAVFLLPLYLFKIKLFFVPFNVLEIIVWILFAGWLITRRYKNFKPENYQAVALPSFLILIGVILGTILSPDIKTSAGILKGWFLAPMIFALVASAEIRGIKDAKKILFCFFASSFLVSLISMLYYFAGAVSFDGRLSAIFLSPNHLAMYLAPGFLIGLWLKRLARERKEAVLIWICLLIIGASLYWTYSYLAWLAILIVISVQYLVTHFDSSKTRRVSDRLKKREKILCALLFLGLIVILFFFQLGSEKLGNLLDSSRSSWQSRLMIWKAAGQIIKDNPIFGIGPGMFQDFYLKYQSRFDIPYLEWAVPQPHNIFLAFWLQAGIIGLVGFIWLLIVFFKKIFNLMKTPHQKTINLSESDKVFGTGFRPSLEPGSDSSAGINSLLSAGAQKNQLALILFSLAGYMIIHGLADTPYFKNDLAMIFWLIIVLAAVNDFSGSGEAAV